MAQHVTFTCSLAEPSKPGEVELKSRRSEEAIVMEANHLDSSSSSDLSDRFDLHSRDEDEGLEKHTTSAIDQENNSSQMNEGSLTRREEKEVSVFCMVSLSTLSIRQSTPAPLLPQIMSLLAAAGLLQNSV